MRNFFILVNCFITIFFTNLVFGAGPEVVCNGLPGCSSNTEGGTSTINELGFFEFLGKIISEGIKYVAVISVIAIVIAGMKYILSGGDDQKTKSAKQMIIWSLVGVILSVGSWAIVNLVNSFSIK